MYTKLYVFYFIKLYIKKLQNLLVNSDQTVYIGRFMYMLFKYFT